MTVTKQQQLEWLAINYDEWPFRDAWVFMCQHSPMVFASSSGIRITKKEWQQERDKMQKQPAQPAQPAPDNSWHERGEFPPAGCECEAFADSCEPEVCTILAIHNGTAAVKWSKFNNGGLDVITLNGWSFRPLRTEREKAIDAACAAVCKAGPYDHERELIGKLYDAGMLK